MRRAAKRSAHCAALLALAAAPALAQDDDILRPPRLDRAEEPPRPTPTITEPEPPARARPSARAVEQRGGRPPNAARLAPLPEQRPNPPDEIVVVAQGWRLPDLGSAWRAKQAEEAGRAGITILPLYDPEKPQQWSNTFLLNREAARVGYIELFRGRFGRKRSAE
jgi:hypothetical protein